METKKLNSKTTNQIIRILLIVTIMLANIFLFINPAKAAALTPTDSQYLEMRATDIKEVDGQGKQLIFELWAHDIDFQGFDVRFSYDETQYQPSNITTNETTDNEYEFFAFESEFDGRLEMFTLPESSTNIIRAIISFLPPVDDSEHIKDQTLISSGADVLIAKMSFKMTADVFDVSKFKLVEDTEGSPTTGIKITKSVTDTTKEYYEEQSTFRFTDKTASKDATLKDIKISTGVNDETNPDNDTYKEYALTPAFDKDTKEYTLELNEYLDKMNIKVEKNDEKATMKVKAPKRDDDGNLVYEADGTTIVYEEKDLDDNTETEFTLNKLGEPDTILEVIVTAEDGKTTEKYKVTIHRPYGTIKGSVQLGTDLRDSILASYGITVEYVADVIIYKNGDFNWSGLLTGETSYSDLDLVNKEIQTKSEPTNGKYELKVIPGNYDLEITKPGFMDYVKVGIIINEGDSIDLGNKILKPGDVDRNGYISLMDFSDTLNHIDAAIGAPNAYGEEYDEKFDFGKKGYISLFDISTVLTGLNIGDTMVIE